MMINDENDLRAEIQSALILSLESIRDAVNLGWLTRDDLVHEMLWKSAARAYTEASDHIESLGLTPASEPLWLMQADADDPIQLGAIQKWLEANQGDGDAVFVFPDMPPSDDFAYSVLFLTSNKETATLFKMFHS